MTYAPQAQGEIQMYQKSKGAPGDGGLHLGAGLAVALLVGFSAAAAGCPGPAPQTGAGGYGGATASSTVSTSEVSSSEASSSEASSSDSSSSSTTSVSSTSASSTSGGPLCPMPYTCVASAPDGGWTGPIEFRESTGATLPMCSPSTTEALHGGIMLSQPPATCSPCTCKAPTGVACGAPTVTVSSSSTCAVAQTCAKGDVTSCAPLPPVVGCNVGASALYVSVSALATGGSCMPSPQMPMTPPVKWAVNVVGCSFDGDMPVACGSGGTCAPIPNATSDFKLCVYQSGDHTCPTGPYTQRTLITTDYNDTRTCSDCACAAPQAQCLNGHVSLSLNLNCGNGTIYGVPTTCAAVTNPAALAYNAEVLSPPMPGNGACAFSGGGATGGVMPVGQVTICCM